ncbi:hypothetical protein FRC09_007121 [Ceratobasidium sp. 395]|nr:hypothetical protein FRC09_007121 [Ceratobasidium sp. 395]
MSNSHQLLRGKKVLVIGGSSGVGRSVAAATLAHGASVVISSSSQDRVATAVKTLRQNIQGRSDVSVVGYAFNIKDTAALTKFLTENGPFDHLAITAGDPPGNTNFPTQPIDESIKAQFDSRYWAVVTAAEYIHKHKLIHPGGSITLTLGTAQTRPLPGWGLINGVMGAVESSVRGLAVDLKPLRINAIELGLVNTELYDKTPPELRDSIFKSYEDKVLVEHVGTADEVAEAYIFAMKASKMLFQNCFL